MVGKKRRVREEGRKGSQEVKRRGGRQKEGVGKRGKVKEG